MPRPKKIIDENPLLQKEEKETEIETSFQEEEKWSGKATIKSKTLKETKVVLLDGVTVSFDKEGLAEIEEERIAKYLLSIPSYELVKN